MRIFNTSSLRNGMVLSKDITYNSKVIYPKHTLLTDDIISALQNEHTYIAKVWVYDLKELTNVFVKNSTLTDEYIKFLFNTTRKLIRAVTIDTRASVKLLDTIYRHFFTNRTLLYEAIVLRDSHQYTCEHSVNVALFAMLIGMQLGLSSIELQDLLLGCILHDFGKKLINNDILNKPGRLDRDEFMSITQHPIYGVELAQSLSSLNKNVINIILQHHEKLDGSGYPYGLVDKEINYLARITTVADIFDASTAERSYHPSHCAMYGINILKEDIQSNKIGKEEVLALQKQVILLSRNTWVELNNGMSGYVLHNCTHERPVVVSNDGFIFDLAQDSSLAITYVA